MVTHGYETYCGDHFIRYIIVKSLSYITEINIILFVRYNFFKNCRLTHFFKPEDTIDQFV